jgi:hypothetical protein
MEECPICLNNITDDTKKITQCKHTFHTECLTRWLHDNNSCPLCRTHFNEPIPIPLIVPLSFWFSRNTNAAIPLISIPFALFPEDNAPSGTSHFTRIYNSNPIRNN